MLQQLDYLPTDLLQVEANQLNAVLQGPTLIHLPGLDARPLFVSVLMHGNETVGWDAIRRLLDGYMGKRNLPRALSLFIGNISAAAQSKRRLHHQPDYNRVWPGSETSGTDEHAMMERVVEIMRKRQPFASVDIHNNTGVNPHYACVNRLDHRYLHLATLFGRTVVYFIRPKGVQSMAMAQLCPSVTLECGKVGQSYGTDHAHTYLEACLHLSEHPQDQVSPQDIDLFHTVAQVKIPEGISFDFSSGPADINFIPDLEFMNFRELPEGTPLALAKGHMNVPLDVRDETGQEVTERFFNLEDHQICLSRSVMPSMLTIDETVIRQDCLCYLMERYNDHLSDAGE